MRETAASPLRYPGGKARLLGLAVQILRPNGLQHGHYAEPYAGGAGLALSLLYGGHVAEIHINDLDAAVWAFWHSALNRTEAFCSLVSDTAVTIDEWRRQRDIHRHCDPADPLKLGFAAFFLNRTNRSGVIKDGGVIGGLAQKGGYKIDCRFNRADLARRINRVRRYRDQIHLSRLDATDFLQKCDRELPQDTLLFIDPPYFQKGPGLYTSFYKAKDHATVARQILSLGLPWVVTYDDCPEIRALYQTRRQFSFDIHYSLNEKRLGSELLIVSKGLRVPSAARQRQIKGQTLQAA